ncbi:hypothetical protein BH10CYA1_BH10CYA1_58580 [soil metagenome]
MHQMLTQQMNNPKPSQQEIEQMWLSLSFDRITEVEIPISDVLEQLNKIGLAEFAKFRVSQHWVLDWFGSLDRFEEIDFFQKFLKSPSVIGSLTQLELKDTLPCGVLKLEPSSAFTFDGEVAKALYDGGAYSQYHISDREAKNFGIRLSDSLFSFRYSEVPIYRSSDAWSDWFYGIAWDITWFGFDKRNYECWLLCLTDTD